MMTNTSADLRIDPTAPLGDAAEDSGAFGTVCEPVGPIAKKSVKRYGGFFYIYKILVSPS